MQTFYSLVRSDLSHCPDESWREACTRENNSNISTLKEYFHVVHTFIYTQNDLIKRESLLLQRNTILIKSYKNHFFHLLFLEYVSFDTSKVQRDKSERAEDCEQSKGSRESSAVSLVIRSQSQVAHKHLAFTIKFLVLSFFLTGR